MPESETKTFFINGKDKIAIPDELHEIITKNGQNILAIVTKGGSKTILFPTNAEKGIYTRIKINKEYRLDDAFFIALKKLLDKFNIVTLYTTGVCVKSEECYWEGIFSYSKEFDEESFKNALSSIKTVESVLLNIIEPSK